MLKTVFTWIIGAYILLALFGPVLLTGKLL